MLSSPEPTLKPVALKDLRPTQMTVGFREVAAKRELWRNRNHKGTEKAATFLGQHMIPVVIGPNKRNYIIDHHHLARALHEEGVESVLVSVVANLSVLEKAAFWVVLDNRGWMHPFDAKGKRCDYQKVPKSIGALADDPFRSLAGELRLMGGYAKNTTPFSEFLWADYLRRAIKLSVLEKDFNVALEEAMVLARDKKANYLPGWCGPSGQD